MDSATIDLDLEETSNASARKTRMVSFRLDSAQYEALKRLYREHGARSVSEFTREAIERLIANQPDSVMTEGLADRFEALERRVETLADEVSRLAQLAKRLFPAGGAS